jgi:hypothetical protein
MVISIVFSLSLSLVNHTYCLHFSFYDISRVVPDGLSVISLGTAIIRVDESGEDGSAKGAGLKASESSQSTNHGMINRLFPDE